MKELNEETARSILKTVEDPEIMLDIVTLGLVYTIKVDDKTKKADVIMTLTTPMCPYGPMIVEEVIAKLEAGGFSKANVEVVFDPPWEPSEEVKMMLGLV